MYYNEIDTTAMHTVESNYRAEVRADGARIMGEVESMEPGDERNERIYELTSEIEIIGIYRAKIVIAITDQDELDLASDYGLELSDPRFWEALASLCYQADIRDFITRQYAMSGA